MPNVLGYLDSFFCWQHVVDIVRFSDCLVCLWITSDKPVSVDVLNVLSATRRTACSKCHHRHCIDHQFSIFIRSVKPVVFLIFWTDVHLVEHLTDVLCHRNRVQSQAQQNVEKRTDLNHSGEPNSAGPCELQRLRSTLFEFLWVCSGWFGLVTGKTDKNRALADCCPTLPWKTLRIYPLASSR